MQAFEGSAAGGTFSAAAATARFEDDATTAAGGHFGASQRYVSILQSHRHDEEASRKQRSQRRARYVIGLTDSYRRSADESRDRLLKDKASMRSQKEFAMLSQLAEITKWHEVIRANATSRQQVRDQNELAQCELHEAHIENLRDHLAGTAERQREDDSERWRALVEKRRRDREQAVSNMCRELVEEAVGRAADVVGFGADHDLPLPLTQAVPSVLFEQWQREHLESEEDKTKRLMQGHVSLELYGHEGPAPHSPAVVSMLCRALATLRPPAPPSRPENPQPWPLVFVTGPRYSGKSVVAEAVAEELGMLYFSDQSLVSAAMEELEQDFTTEDLSDPAKSELVDIGHSLQQGLLAGEAVPIDTMARLIAHCVRNAPEDCAGMIIDGIQMTVESVKAIEALLSGYADPTEPETLLLAPAAANDPAQFEGRLSVSRPTTAIAEVAVTQGRERGAKGGAKKKKEDEEPLPPVDIPPLFHMPPLSRAERAVVASYQSSKSVLGTAKIVAIECDAEALFDRVSKVRFDAETGEEYHLDLNPPPEDRLAYLQIRDRPDQDCGNMFANLESYAAQWEPTERWLQRFGGGSANDDDGAEGCLVGSVQATIGSAELPEMVNALRSIVEAAAEERREYCHTVAEARRITEHREELAAQQKVHNKRRDAVKRQLLALYMERQVDPLPVALTEPDWEASQPVEMTPTLATVLLDTLSSFTEGYTETVSRTHAAVNETLAAFYAHNDACAERFELYWRQEDRRQEVLSNFLARHVETDRNMYVLTAAKEEAHYRLDRLQAELWRIVEGRKAEGIALIEQLCAKGTIVEAVNEALRGLGAALVQCELDRFLVVRHMTLTYFGALKDAPAPLDLTDVLPSEVLPALKGGVAAEKEAEAAPAGKGAPKKVPPKKGKGNVPPPEEADRPQEDMLLVVKAKAAAMMEGLLDKLTIVSQAPAKAKKGVVETTRADANSPGAMATPIVEEEMRAAALRIEVIVDYFNGIADTVVIAQTSRLWDRLSASLHAHYMAQIAAVNAAVFYLRDRVERETPPTCKLLLGLEAFAEDTDVPLVTPPASESEAEDDGDEPKMVPEVGSDQEEEDDDDDAGLAVLGEGEDDTTAITSSLTIRRAHAIIGLFKVCAPDFRLHRRDFVRIVRPEDYCCAGEEVCSVEELFDRFDDWGAGVIDWRLFIVHLIFWCEPLNATVKAYEATHGEGSAQRALAAGGQQGGLDDSRFSDDSGEGGPFVGGGPVRRNKYYVEGPDFLSLVEMRGDLGDEAIESEDHFVNEDHFFGSSMPDDEDEDRFVSYCNILWATFAVDGRLDPQTFILFLCPDEQPLRGMQKAFGVVSSATADDNCALSHDLFDTIFHVFANNPRALGVWDPCSVTALQAIYESVGAPAVQFQDLCGIHAGRMILNNFKCYERKSFVK